MKDKSDSFVPQMFKDLEGIQVKLMSNPIDNSLWLQEHTLQDSLKNMHWKRPLLGSASTTKLDPIYRYNTKYFQIAATIEKRHNNI